MYWRLKWFAIYFLMLFGGGTVALSDGRFNFGTLLGSLLTAAVITAIIQPKKNQ